MKILYKTFLALSLALSLVQAGGFEKEINAKDLKVQLISQKSLVVGMNTMSVQIQDGGKALEDAKVEVRIFMPAMPGMPAMKSTTEAKPMGKGRYEAEINFSMSGTWQMHIFITPISQKPLRVKTSVNL